MKSFDNTERAFAHKSDKDLKRANMLFSAMGNSFVLNAGLKLTPLAMKFNIPFTKTILRETIFKQFVGGETLEETANVANKLANHHVKVILDYGVEGGSQDDNGYEEATGVFLKVINYASSQANIPFISIKLTGIVRFSLLEKIDAEMHKLSGSLIKKYETAIENLGPEEKGEWERFMSRTEKICEACEKNSIRISIDAEETWIQDPIDVAAMLMMDKHNRNQPIIYNTLQMYRHDRLQFLADSIAASKERGFILGMKLVRGAYMEKERHRAEELGYASPIQPDKESTDRDYNKAIQLCIENIDRTALIVATHNEYSNLFTTELMDKFGISHKNPYVHFSQLYGMSDNITFNLAAEGFSVSKYLPFGPIKDVVPYLLRRARENSSVKGSTGRELNLIKKELKRRGL